MKAFSKSDRGPLIAGAITLVLGIFFWLPAGPRSVSLTPPINLEGKTWTLHEPAPARTESPAAAMPTAKKTARPTATHGQLKNQRSLKTFSATTIGSKEKLDAPHAADSKVATTSTLPSPPPEVKENSLVAANAVIPPGTLDPIQQYTMQDLIDSFESDPSRYPMDRTIKMDGIALTLEGLQRREKIFVIKIAVANGADADFFIKDFTVRAGTTVLGSRTLFRILVEPRRVREGYVVFEKPKSGAALQIQLKEDGGTGRSLETGVPYRF